MALSHLSGGHSTASQSVRSPKLLPYLSSAQAPPHSGGDPSLQQLILRAKHQPWLPLVRDLNHLSSFPTATHNSCWLCSASQFRNACSHQILAESSSPRDLSNICSSEICRFHRVWLLESYILGMCNSSFPQPGLHRAPDLTWCPWLWSGVGLRKEHTKNSSAFHGAGLESSITSTNAGHCPIEIRRKS